jgi:hypothetical protein
MAVDKVVVQPDNIVLTNVLFVFFGDAQATVL